MEADSQRTNTNSGSLNVIMTFLENLEIPSCDLSDVEFSRQAFGGSSVVRNEALF